jgi:hypothetical protein
MIELLSTLIEGSCVCPGNVGRKARGEPATDEVARCLGRDASREHRLGMQIIGARFRAE